MAHDLDNYYHVVLELTKEAGKVIRTAIKKKKNIQMKSSEVDLVTETDQEVEKLLITRLKKQFPDHRFIGEESTAAGQKCELTDAPTWIIDPVDGTMNFVHGFPFVAVSIALLINKTAEIGIVYNAVLEQMYTARRGQGAFHNGEKIHASEQDDLAQALIISEIGTNRNPEKLDLVLTNTTTLLPLVHGIRSMGSCALNMAFIATGAADAYTEIGIHAWDIAAGDLIVREAGGVVVDTTGGPLDLMGRRVLCAGTRTLADKLSKLLKHMQLSRD